MRSIDFSKLTEAGKYSNPDGEEETELVRKMLRGAADFLRSFEWCLDIRETYVGDVVVGRVFGTFLFRIRPGALGVDEWLWLVNGDVPPAFLVTDDAPNPACALWAYVEEMGLWVRAVKSGRPVDDLIPVLTSDGDRPLAATRELGEMLEGRLQFIRDYLNENRSADLALCAPAP